MDAPEKGQGYSIGLGLSSIESPVMFFTADQPLTSCETIKRLAEEHLSAPESIIIPTSGGLRRNPVVFPAKAVEPLKHIEGDRGGKVVIDSGNFDVRSVDFADCMQFTDIDDLNDYETVKKIWASENL